MILVKKKIVGLDISDKTIEVVELVDEGDRIKIVSMGRVYLTPGIVERGRIKDNTLLSGAIKQALAKARPKPIETRKVVFGFPESQVYIHIFELGPHDKSERDDLILKEAKISIPLDTDDLLFSYSMLSEKGGNTEILLIVVSKEVFSEWQLLFQEMKLQVEYFDIETLATFRGLFVEKPETATCIVDIGAAATTIAIFNRQGLRYSYSLDVAGDTMTKDIVNEMGVSTNEAEELKVKMGLSNREKRIFFILIKTLQPIIEGIKSSFGYFQEKTGENIRGIVLVGGSSKLKGLTGYFKKQFGQSVWLGESILLRNKTSLEYIEAIGLALRGFNRKEDRNDPVIRVKIPRVSTSARKRKAGKSDAVEVYRAESLTPLEVEQIKKLKFEKIAFVVILIVGVAAIFLADWYRDYRAANREEVRLESIEGAPSVPEEGLATAATSTPESASPAMVLISDTPTGELNVRGGPETSYPVITKVKSGEEYLFMEESGDWFKISIDEGTEGWVFNGYSEKL